LLSREQSSRVTDEGLEQGKLAARQGNFDVISPDPMRQQVDPQAVPGDDRRLGLVGAACLCPDTRQPLIEVERLGDVVVSAFMQRIDLAGDTSRAVTMITG
jgi:hypothetical protein